MSGQDEYASSEDLLKVLLWHRKTLAQVTSLDHAHEILQRMNICISTLQGGEREFMQLTRDDVQRHINTLQMEQKERDARLVREDALTELRKIAKGVNPEK